MRDLFIFAMFFAAVSRCLVNPFYATILWIVVSIMNPHRLTYGSAYYFPFAQISAGVLFVSLILAKKDRNLTMDGVRVALLCLVGWMVVTQIAAINPTESQPKFSETLKTLLMVFVSFITIRTREHLYWTACALYGSVIFYGVKGGIFTIVTAGSSLVWGPPGSHIADNNAISVALIIVFPLGAFLYMETKNFYARMAILLFSVLSIAAILGSHSRGALLTLSSTLIMLWLKSSKKIIGGIALAVAFVFGLMIMPEKWWDRMGTISTFDEDVSVQGRFNGWAFAWNLAKDNPLTGGGFYIYTPELFLRYAPIPDDIHSTHNIFFQYLGEHGFVGLFFFISVLVGAHIFAFKVNRMTRPVDSLRWAGRLASMCQISLVAFMVAGMSVNIGYWDMAFYIVLLVSVTYQIVKHELLGLSSTNQRSLGMPIGRRYSRM